MTTFRNKIITAYGIAHEAITSPDFVSSDAVANGAWSKIQELMQDIHSLPASISPFLSEVPSLDKNQYIIPVELQELHEEFTDFLKTKRNLSEFTHTGMCIHGPIGNGKSEYVHYLKGLLGDKVDFIQLSVSALRGSENPSAELEKIYRDLSSKYKDSDKYVVLFMDEFDQLFSTELESASKTSTSSRSNSSSSTQSTSTEKTATIDPVGTSLYNSFKTLLSGSGFSQRIFTITTTNKTIEEVPDVLRRPGRLESVNVENPFKDIYRNYTTFGSEYDTYTATRYDQIPTFLVEIFDVCLAIENRSSAPISDNITILEELRKDWKKIVSRKKLVEDGGILRGDTDGEKRYAKFQKNSLEKVVKVFGYDEDIYNKFKGFLLASGGTSRRRSDDIFPEIDILININRSEIAELYKNHRRNLSTDQFSKNIAKFLFPQLRDVD